MQKQCKRILATVFGLALLCSLLLFSFLAATHSGHDCPSDDCVVCYHLSQTQKQLVAGGSVWLQLSGMVLAGILLCAFCSQILCMLLSPVALRVRLDS